MELKIIIILGCLCILLKTISDIRRNHTIDIELTYKDGFDTPPIGDDEPYYY